MGKFWLRFAGKGWAQNCEHYRDGYCLFYEVMSRKTKCAGIPKNWDECVRQKTKRNMKRSEQGVEPKKQVCAQSDLGSTQNFICSECSEEIPNAVQYEPPDLTMRCSGIARKCSCGWICCLRCDPAYNQPENGHECPQCGKFHRGWVRWDPHRNMVDRSGWIQIDGESDHWFKGCLWELWKKDRESDRWTTIRRMVVKRLKLSDEKKG